MYMQRHHMVTLLIDSPLRHLTADYMFDTCTWG